MKIDRSRMLCIKNVKQYCKQRDKRIGKEGLNALNEAVMVLLNRAITNSGRFQTLKTGEVAMAVAKGGI